MTTVPIYDADGALADTLEIDDQLTYLEGRLSKGKKYFYKGVGVPYNGHSINEPTPDYRFVSKSPIFYSGNRVVKTVFKDKFGIFQEPFQVLYTDWIGACGVKEGKIVLNSIIFDWSAVDVLGHVQFDKENDQSYYTLDYRCARDHYVDNGDPQKLTELLAYMLKNDWNFLWDKNSISDITTTGHVTDVADLFQSDELKHKLGTIYSVLYSLGMANMSKYKEFLSHNYMQHSGHHSFVVNAVNFMHRQGLDVLELLPYARTNINDNYRHVVQNYLVVGKNCAHCACDMYTEKGEEVLLQYQKQVESL